MTQKVALMRLYAFRQLPSKIQEDAVEEEEGRETTSAVSCSTFVFHSSVAFR